MPLSLYAITPLRLPYMLLDFIAFSPLHLYAFTPLRLYAVTPLRLLVFMLLRIHLFLSYPVFINSRPGIPYISEHDRKKK